MFQLLMTPHCVYKVFRKLVQGHITGGSLRNFYIDKSIAGAITNIKYFKLGTGAPEVGGNTVEVTRTWFDANIKDKNSGKGDLAIKQYLYASGGYGSDPFKKELLAANFYDFGSDASTKVIGVLSVTPNAPLPAHYWNVPGILFQVGCQLTQVEANFVAGETYPPTILSPGDSVYINEVGLFDEDDILCFYGVFDKQAKNNALTLKVNCVGMVKTLDYQLV
jgi:hypothetical protein